MNSRELKDPGREVLGHPVRALRWLEGQVSISPAPGEGAAPVPAPVPASGGGQSPAWLWRQLSEAGKQDSGARLPQRSVWEHQGAP